MRHAPDVRTTHGATTLSVWIKILMCSRDAIRVYWSTITRSLHVHLKPQQTGIFGMSPQARAKAFDELVAAGLVERLTATTKP